MRSQSDSRVPVLIVDDNDANLLALDVVLEPGGYDVVRAKSGAEALKHVEKRDFAVVLLDVQMPIMDGLETATRIRAMRRSEHPVPIIFVTGIDGSPARVLRAYTEGAVDFIQKPLEPEMIRAKVAVFAELFRVRNKLAEEKAEATGSLRHTRAWLATTLRSIGDGVIATDARGHVTFLNATAERLTGFSEAEARDRPLAEIFPIFSEHTGRAYASPATSVIESGSVIGLADDTVLVTRTGQKLAIADSAAPIRDDEERLIGVVIVFRDATAERRDRARRDFLARAGAVLASSLPDYRATLASIAKFAVPQLADACAIDLDETSASTELTDRTMVVPLRAHKGHLGTMRFTYEASGRKYAEDDLEFAEEFARRAAMAIENAVALKQANEARAAEERLRKEADVANRAKDEFLATVSHELRTPLAAMLGWAVTLRAKKVPEEIDRPLAIIERNARRQARLIDDLLDVSRIISGKLTLSLAPTSVSDTIKRAIESVTPTATAKGLELHAEADPNLRLMGDPDRLQQVVWNLLVNAVKFTPEGGRVAVQAHRHGKHAVIRVVDNGAGIPSHSLRTIFEPFRQGDSSITRKHGGLGLGLAIVNQLVALHQGTIEAHSDGLGRGSTFVVRVPALEGPSAAAELRVDHPNEIPRLDGLSVLVVEDEEDTRTLIEYVLHSQGASVTTSPSVADALEKMSSDTGETPDVIISDIGLPEVDGYSFMRKVREINTDTPAVALTAYARREDIENATAAGYDLHIAKPIEPARLILAVDQLVRRRGFEHHA